MYLPLLNETLNEKLLQIAIFFTSLLCSWTIIMLLRQRHHKTHTFKALQNRIKSLRENALASVNPDSRSVSFMRATAKKLKLIEPERRSATETLLSEAGFFSHDAVYVLAFMQFVLPTAFGLVAFVAIFHFHPPASPAAQLLNYGCAVLAAYIGVKLPVWYLRQQRGERYRRIRKSLPDMLDLMTISVEAGLSLPAAMENVSQELAAAHPDLADELKITSAEGNFLSDRHKALVNWAERCRLPEVRGIVSVLVQTEKFGTPVAQALQVLASEFRQARMLAAEQKAIRLPVVMTVPMMLCIMPTIFIIILSPAVMRLVDMFHHH